MASKFETGPLGAAVLIAAPLVGACLFYVWTHVTTVRLGYDLSRADLTHRRLLAEQHQLSVRYGNLVSPKNLEALATQRGFAYRPSQTVKLAMP